jgi:hypothetical protein
LSLDSGVQKLFSLLQSYFAGITEVLDPKGLREGMSRQDTYQEGQKADDQLENSLFFSASFIQKKRGRDLNIKTLCLITAFLFWSPCILTASVLD